MIAFFFESFFQKRERNVTRVSLAVTRELFSFPARRTCSMTMSLTFCVISLSLAFKTLSKITINKQLVYRRRGSSVGHSKFVVPSRTVRARPGRA